MAAKEDKAMTASYLRSLNNELNGKALYEALSKIETNPKLSEIYRRFAETEGRHASTWVQKLKDSGSPAPEGFHATWRTRLLILLARRFGTSFVLPSVQALEESDRSNYEQQQTPESSKLAADERSHSRLLRQVAGTSGGVEGGVLARFEGRHRSTGGNALRAAVLGANDGLVSNLSLVMAVAGAALAGTTIVLTGLAGLVAGGISMALGEWLSVNSARELYQHQISIEKAELEAMPEEEAEELALIYESKGLDQASAKRLSAQIIENGANALDTLAREELGINPESLGGSAMEAAATSFALFTAGAVVPVAPFVFLSGLPAVLASILASSAMLFAIGGLITLFTGKSILSTGLRQVIFGLAAAAITYGVGRLFSLFFGV
jgi:VIT1/CCC1 family predicted Fe2+/Mn2+ transporter